MGDVLERFGPATRDWFRGAFAAPTNAQIGAWESISHGRHALVVAPTARPAARLSIPICSADQCGGWAIVTDTTCPWSERSVPSIATCSAAVTN